MKIILISMSLILLMFYYIIGIKENFKVAFINEQAIENMKAKDKQQASKDLASPLVPMAILLGSVAFMNNKWGGISYGILIMVVIFFIYIEIKNIKKINSKFKNKVIKTKKINKNKKIY
ncbi:hypothetical protein [Clostridium tarantellae]|uniref:DUF3784 domain-containing protein n=1 Tax=Clostridium tarantellae TaxID=39493 RepID=A0A6I1MJL7_9CLOT|nr:hypothetical protein [Clostridium tarantellae]MPQ42352.1 hypothetical protein [Clostridium tarantellae]